MSENAFASIKKKPVIDKSIHHSINLRTHETLSIFEKKYSLNYSFGNKKTLKMSVRVINDENHFQAELSAAGIRLVVVDFTASW